MTPVGSEQVVAGTAGRRMEIAPEVPISWYSVVYGVHPLEPSIVPPHVKVAVIVLPWMTDDHTPLVSSYQPSFHAVPVRDGAAAAGVPAGCVAAGVAAGAGVVAGAGWPVQPAKKTASTRRTGRIITVFFIAVMGFFAGEINIAIWWLEPGIGIFAPEKRKRVILS